MAKFQQYSFVCAPSMAQAGLVGAFDIDMSDVVNAFERRRDLVKETFAGIANVSDCAGAFYGFVEVPEHLGITGTEFCEHAIKHNVVVIPGDVFSDRDTHIRISFACPDEKLKVGLEILADMMLPAREPTLGS
jgi:aspartate/methionine/tyrosine aminotransferase